MRPQSAHLWRQCDCLTFTMGYYNGGNSFFEPSLYHLGSSGTGKTASDFPLIYFIVGKLWKVFGQHEFIYRLIVILLFFIGLFALFRSFELLLKDSVIAVFVALLMFTSPTLVYYGNNFLMNIPAFSMALIGLHFFVQFIIKSKDKYLYLFAISFLLAGLLKVSSLLSYVAVCGLFILERFNLNLNQDNKIFQKPWKQFFIMLSVFLIVFSWYAYAANYNSQNNRGFFLIGILPIWDIDAEKIRITFNAIWDHIKWDYFMKETQLLLVLMFVAVLAFYRKVNKALIALIIMLAIGFLTFAILFFQPLLHHDYYTISLFIVVPFVLLGFFLFLKNSFRNVYNGLALRIILVIFLMLNVDFARRRMIWRFSPQSYLMDNYLKNMQRLEGIDDYMRSIGIDEMDKIISISDNSINISLYYAKHKGWTNFGISDNVMKLKDRIDMGAKYLLVYNTDDLKKEYLKPYIHNKIGEYNHVKIFKL